MKEKYKCFRKKAMVVGIVMLFFCMLVPLSASANNVDSVLLKPQLITSKISGLSSDVPLMGPGSGLFIIFPPLLARKGRLPSVSMIRDWSKKSFPNTTLMFIGSGVGMRPLVPVGFLLLSRADPAPKKVHVYTDGTSFAVLSGISFPFLHPQITLYGFSYSKKGFHHLRFVPDNNESAALFIDIQVGFQGFTKNILPYLR